MMRRQKRPNAIYYYLANEGVAAAEVGRVNGISRQSVNRKLSTDLEAMTLKSYIQIAKAMEKPVGKVIDEILAIDKELKAAYE